MSVLYRIASADSGHRVPATAFSKVVDCGCVQELLECVYLDRVRSSNTHIRFSYETDISVILVNERDSIRQLNEILETFMPVLNFKIYCEEDWLHDLDLNNVELINERKLCQFKPMRINHWMHHDHLCKHTNTTTGDGGGGGGADAQETESNCQYNLYSMLKHWKTSTELERSNKDNSNHIPKEISNIDFKSILLKIEPNLDFNNDQFELEILSNWNFSALNLNSVQLIKCAFHLLKKLIGKVGLIIDDNNLLLLIFTLESSYHQINKFHNFNHAIDVMQATWCLCEIILPHVKKIHSFNIDELSLILCFAAIGHDVGHPGTNNSLFHHDSKTFKLFDGNSILENFHYNLFNNLLNKIWPQFNHLLIKNDLNLIETAILATDMGLHSNYVNILTINEKTPENLKLTEIISLIIKAADISNVTRPLTISSKWAFLISLEFKDCSILQKFFEISPQILGDGIITESCQLFAIDKLQSIIYQDIDTVKEYELEVEMFNHIYSDNFSMNHLLDIYPMIPNGQIFFINTFAFEFFNKLNIIFPQLKFLVDNINTNKEYWLSKQ